MDSTWHYGCQSWSSSLYGTTLKGELSERLGRGLQNHLHWFESNIHLLYGVWSFKVKHEFVELGKTVRYRSYTQYCGEEGLPTGLISRVFRVRFSAPQQKILINIL